MDQITYFINELINTLNQLTTVFKLQIMIDLFCILLKEVRLE